MTKPSDVILKVKKKIDGIEKEYVKSEDFKVVAESALIDFIKRVRRGLMPQLDQIEKLESEAYLKLRRKNKGQLGEQGKPTKSNATATGQMLKAMKYKILPNGFLLFVDNSNRSKELSGASPKLTNKEVAKYYSIKRDIFEFSDPEIQRIVRKAKADLLKLIRRLK